MGEEASSRQREPAHLGDGCGVLGGPDLTTSGSMRAPWVSISSTPLSWRLHPFKCISASPSRRSAHTDANISTIQDHGPLKIHLWRNCGFLSLPSYRKRLQAMTMTMTHSEKSNICQMKAWPYRQECRGHDPTKKNLLC